MWRGWTVIVCTMLAGGAAYCAPRAICASQRFLQGAGSSSLTAHSSQDARGGRPSWDWSSAAAFGAAACVVGAVAFTQRSRGKRFSSPAKLADGFASRGSSTAGKCASRATSVPVTDAAPQPPWPVDQTWPLMLRGAFSAQECDEIAQIFVDKLAAESDLRQYEAVARINRFDTGGKLMNGGVFDSVYERVVERTIEAVGLERASALFPDCIGGSDSASVRFRGLVDFNLMHEFDSKHSFFGWHVDTKPGDGTCRTLNLNVMLSDNSEDFSGGALQVGGEVVAAAKGDAYLYPASMPHIVHDLESGTRRTLVVALAEKAVSPSRLEQYWAATEANLNQLASGALNAEPKLHLIRGDFLDATGRPQEARLAFVEQYRVSPQAKEYADHFFKDGVAALQRQPQNFAMALDLFDFAARVDPLHPEAASCAKELREMMQGK